MKRFEKNNFMMMTRRLVPGLADADTSFADRYNAIYANRKKWGRVTVYWFRLKLCGPSPQVQPLSSVHLDRKPWKWWW